jgi:Ca2+-binding RTX toxin-like protein
MARSVWLLSFSSLFLLFLLLFAPPSARAAVTATVSASILTVTANAADNIRITCGADGDVKVNDQDPTGEPDTCSSISQIQVTATGAFPNAIDLTAVTRERFGALQAITAEAGQGDDTVTGGPLAETLSGGAGIDVVDGGAGSDELDGNEQADTLRGGDGDDSLTDGDPTGVDELSGDGGNDTLTGGIGLERVVQAADVDQALSDARLTGLGTDSLTGIDQARLTGGESDNALDATAFTDGSVTLEGLGGSDTLRGGTENDTLTGGVGTDSYIFGAQAFGTDTIVEAPDCGEGDQVDLSGIPAGLSFDIGKAGPQNVRGGTIVLPSETAIETLRGTAMDDQLIGNSCPNELFGGGGKDSLRSLGEADTLLGQDGADDIDGGEGVDVVAQTADADQTLADDRLTGEGPDPLISVEKASLAGGEGQNRLDASLFTRGAVSLFGGAGNDVLIGSVLGDLLDGQAGNDQLIGSEGDDDLRGDLGDDSIYGEGGSDALVAGSGNDLLSGAEGNDRLDGSQGKDRMHGGSGNDLLSGGSEADRLTGSKGRDRLRGDGGPDRLRARDHRRDFVNGGPGRDRAVADREDVVRKVETTTLRKVRG